MRHVGFQPSDDGTHPVPLFGRGNFAVLLRYGVSKSLGTTRDLCLALILEYIMCLVEPDLSHFQGKGLQFLSFAGRFNQIRVMISEAVRFD